MSGFFQRPSLKPDTFDNYDNHSKLTGGGLKAAFQTRTTNHPYEPSFSGSYPPQNELREITNPNEYYQEKHDPIAKPTKGLKGAFERRVSEESRYNDETLKGGLKEAFQGREPISSGLKATLDYRQQILIMEDNESDSSSSGHNAYLNVYGRHRYNETEGSLDNRDDEDQEYSRTDHPVNYHSIHRLSHLNNKQGGSKLKKAFEARTGGTTIRNLGRNHEKAALLEKHANIIVSKMEQDEALMEDSPDAEELRKTTLRDMPQCLTLKKSVKEKLSKSVSQKSKRRTPSCWKMFKYRLSMNIKKFKIHLKDLGYSFELWYEPLKKVEGHFGTGVASFFKFLRWLFLMNCIIAVISTCFIVVPKIISQSKSKQAVNWSIISDLISGEGYLTNTPMYYGFYTNEIVGSSLTYSMPHAYFFTMFSIYFISFIVIGISAARAYRRSFIETEGGLKNVFANKVFCGWDYNIATRDAAQLKSKVIYNEFKELISEYTNRRNKHGFCEKFYTVCIQFFMNVIIICLLAATAYAIWYFLENVSVDRGTRIIVAPIFINAVMTLLPMFLSFLVKYEDYKNPKVSLYLTLARTFVLGAVTIGVLVAFWLLNYSESPCWETSLAQEFYRMIIFDFFISVMCAALLDVFLFIVYKYCRKDTSLEFDIAWNTMHIIYNQTLFWVGLFFSPLLPIVLVIKLFICWYIRLGIALFLCKPSSKSWRAAQASTWFLVMAFSSLLFIGGLLVYIISYMNTSSQCGPFRNYGHIYEIVTFGVLQLKANSTVWQIVLFVTKPGVIALLLLFLAARVYYSRAQANAQKEIVEQCRNMLVWSAKDKEYYYYLISQATAGHWQYKVHDKTVNPELYDSHIYLNSEGIKETADPSMTSQNLSSAQSGTTFLPSSSAASLDADTDDRYSRSKKNT